MANTTFSGPVRSENGFQSITQDTTTGAITVEATYDARPTFRQTVDSSTLNVATAVTTTLTTAQSGTLFSIDGTDDKVVNMPALSTANVGTTYEFLVTVVLAGGKTATFVLPGAGVSNWYAALADADGAAGYVFDVAGDTLTLAAATVVGSRVKLTCVSDDGTNSTWQADVISSPIATVA
jgi:hypothetical protein